MIFFFKQKTAYEMRISDWSSDVCSSDLHECGFADRDRYPRVIPPQSSRKLRTPPALAPHQTPSSPSNRAATCAEDIRNTPSRTCGQTNLPPSRRLCTSTRLVWSQPSTFTLSARCERNTKRSEEHK